MKTLYRYLSAVLLALVTFTLVLSCSQNDGRNKIDSKVSQDDCVVIQHEMGETCVPEKPQRIVVLESMLLEATIALDKKPVGSPLDHVPFPVDTTGIKDLGERSAINLEQVLALKPDLILGLTDFAPPYSQLSQIAPTVLVGSNHSGRWKEDLAFIGEIIGRSEQVERIMTSYNRRIEELRQKINFETNEITVSVVRLDPARISVYTEAGFIGTILEDAGFSRPVSQNLDLEENKSSTYGTVYYTISKEVIDEADGDVVFVIVGDWDAKIKDTLASLKADPLWLKLQAVQQGKVYEVPGYWISGGPISANAVIDDLEKYLVEQ